ncbi:MAG: hypothetical protein AAFQ19_04740 [Pseudomonadota bacterium]
MMNWVNALTRVEDDKTEDCAAGGRVQVTRAEVAALFADDLARPALQKRATRRIKMPRMLIAGRQHQFA